MSDADEGFLASLIKDEPLTVGQHKAMLERLRIEEAKIMSTKNLIKNGGWSAELQLKLDDYKKYAAFLRKRTGVTGQLEQKQKGKNR